MGFRTASTPATLHRCATRQREITATTTYGTKVIVTTRREAHYVLDELLGNATDLPITEHATDTHGVTLVNFVLFDLLGMQLSPRIRDLGKITLYRPAPRADAEARFPHAGPLLTRKLNLDLIAEHYDDLLRLAGSLKFGHATASLLVGKLSAAGGAGWVGPACAGSSRGEFVVGGAPRCPGSDTVFGDQGGCPEGGAGVLCDPQPAPRHAAIIKLEIVSSFDC